ncbi:hypothetical protein GYH30_021520 [Glycine max]|nr:hypothetical protein GYH30_021520 [Glycine max]
MGYPSKDGPAAVGYTQHKDFQRKPKPGVMDFERNGDCAALCCCCVLDCCF